MEQKIQVVDHQVAHDVDVRAPRGELGQPVDLEKTRGGHGGGQGLDRRVETLGVTDHDQTARPLGSIEDHIGLVECPRQRLFDQHVDAVLEQRRGHDMVLIGWNGHAGCLYVACQPGDVVVDGASELFRDRPCPLGIAVHDPDQLDAVELAIEPRVVPAQMSDADDADLEGLHSLPQRQMPRSLERTNSTK